MSFKRWIVLFAFLGMLVSPTLSYACEIDYFESFGHGFESLQGKSENEVVTPESDFIEEYEPVLRETSGGEVEEGTTNGMIQNVVYSFTRVPNGGNSTADWRQMAAWFLRTLIVPIAVLLVFMWWGVRKGIRILFAAFRRGKANV